MNERAKRRWSFASAAALALITLFVFFVLQNYGPESAVRRLHVVGRRIAQEAPGEAFQFESLSGRDAAEIRAITIRRPDSNAIELIMANFVLPVATRGASYEVVRIDYQSPSVVIAVVQYAFPNMPGADYRAWVVQQLDNGDWRVDPEATIYHWMNMRSAFQ